MLIKVKMSPDNDMTGDLGTNYIVTEHQGFVKALENITDCKVMAHFLDENKQYYTELAQTPEHFDREIDVSASFVKLIENNEMEFGDKVIRGNSLPDVPKVIG